jgi:hypothetical protein
MSDWSEAFKLEMKVAHIISEQGRNGCNFDSRAAHWHNFVLREEIVNIDKELVPQLPMMRNQAKSHYKKPFKISGKLMPYVQVYADRVGLDRSEVCGPFTPVWYTPFNPGKVSRVKEVMFDYGWIPNEWNTKKIKLLSRNQISALRSMTYHEFLSKQHVEVRETCSLLVEGFLVKHFKEKSVMYMKGVLRVLGFRSGKPPGFNEIRKRLLSKAFWPTSPKIDPDKDKWASAEHENISSLLRERMQFNHRKSLMEGLLKVVRADGKIAGEANPCATPTARMRHRKIVNIPSGGAVYGKQCRKLFKGDFNDDKTRKPIILHNKPGKGEGIEPHTNLIKKWDGEKKEWRGNGRLAKLLIPARQDIFVGGDGAGLELRMLTHYLIKISREQLEIARERGNGSDIRKFEMSLQSALEYRKTLLEGDIHTHNQKLAGLPTRGDAKGFIYSFLYGAGDELLGKQIGGGKIEGARIKATFLSECPCIPVLIEWAQAHAEKYGWVPGLDGRKLMMRRDPETGNVQTHKALNVLLQAAGSIVMKRSNAILINNISDEMLNARQVIMMHDEYQFSVSANDYKVLMQHIETAVRDAGIYYDMECPLASDSMVGANWYHTH